MTLEEFTAIDSHLGKCLDACESALLNLAKIKKPDQRDFIKGQLAYWRNARSAFRWARGIAQQQFAGKENADSTQVQQSGPDTCGGGGDILGVDDCQGGDGRRLKSHDSSPLP